MNTQLPETSSGRDRAVRTSRSFATILRANLFTRFNAILGGLFVVVLFVGPPQDGLFGVVLVINAAIGIAQELRTKRALDRLALLNAPVAHVLRDQVVRDCRVDEVVVGDIVELVPGDQLVADGTLRDAQALQLDESLISGESVPIDKSVGEEVLSGSLVVSGWGRMEVSRVGEEAFAQRLQLEARQYSLTYSELQQGTNQLLRFISILLVPAAVLLGTGQFLRSHIGVSDALRGIVAGVGAMVPEGLVLLTTLAFALGALRLTRRRVLVQSLPAIEGLARIDVLCIDKTGTLTLPGITVDRVIGGGEVGSHALGALARFDRAPNATMRAIATAFPHGEDWEVTQVVPFSSERKWSAMEFHTHGGWYLGAPDVLVSKVRLSRFLSESAKETATLPTRRSVLLAHRSGGITGEHLPVDLEPVCVVVLSEEIRPNAQATMQYLRTQGVVIKVISGDEPATVAAIAERVGVPMVGVPVDARELPEDPVVLAELMEHATVFGRVRPHQKRAMVEAIQSKGHVVGMTGDGVNDVAALKQADIGIAMGSGSQASRAVASLVLLGDDFAVFPEILQEGRRVVGNIGRVAKLFVTKTVYAALLALVVGIVGMPYPFYPRQFTVISTLTVGIPGFALALSSAAPRAQPGFVGRVVRFAIPAGAAAATATLVTYGLVWGPLHGAGTTAKLSAAMALFLMALWALALLARPLDGWRLGLVSLMALGGLLVTQVPYAAELFAFGLPPWRELVVVAGVVTPVGWGLWFVLRVIDRIPSAAHFGERGPRTVLIPDFGRWSAQTAAALNGRLREYVRWRRHGSS